MKKAIYLLTILAIAGCTREPLNEVISREPVVIPPTELVLGSISGVITDEDGMPLTGVRVMSGNDVTETGDDGEFIFMDIELYADGTFLTAEKTGYFNGSRKFNAKANQVNNVKIQLLTQVILKEITTQNGGIVNMSNASIEFPSGDYIREDLTSYNGIINVSGKYLNPSLEATHAEMPGELIGFDESNGLKALASYGILKLGMESDNQDLLDLPEGQPIIIYMDIAQDLLASAPPEVDLSYFYTSSGSWVHEGTAERVGNQYVATVSKAGFWNFNVPLDFSEVSGNIYVNETLSPDTKVKITALSAGYQAYTTTTGQGYFSGYLPKSMELEATVYKQCANFPNRQTVAPITENAKNLELRFQLEPASDATIRGEIRNCNNLSSQSNYLRVDIGSDIYMIKAADSGQYMGTLPINTCKANSITVYGMDLENGYTTEPINRTLSDLLDIETLTPCTKVPAGFNISYMHMDWEQALESSVRHSWKVNTISGGSASKFLINPSIIDEENGEVYMTGAIVFDDGASTAVYKIEYKTQGFEVSGNCALAKEEHDGFNSYRFTGTSSDIKVTNPNLFPVNGIEDIGEVTIDLVYYY